MIEKMQFVTLSGPKTDLDNLIKKYLSKVDIHLDNAVEEFDHDHLNSYYEENPFESYLPLCEDIASLIERPEKFDIVKIKSKDACELIDETHEEIQKNRNAITKHEAQLSAIDDEISKIEPFTSLNTTIEKLSDLSLFTHRFGRIPHKNFEKFDRFIKPDIHSIFIETSRDNAFVYGLFLIPLTEVNEISKTLVDIAFEEIHLPSECPGLLSDEISKFEEAKDKIQELIDKEHTTINEFLNNNRDKLLSAIRRIQISHNNFDVRKLAGVTGEHDHAFQTVCGWMTVPQAKKLEEKTKDDPNVICTVNDDVDEHRKTPPVKLKNNRFIRPFETFVRMYGMPNYHEFDPTWFLCLTYSIIFGMMFGDIGQGLCLLIIGLILYKIKHFAIAGVACCVSVFSILFGALFGSFFGFEFESVIHPLHSIAELPIVGRINHVIVAAFFFGAFIILVTMIVNMANAIKRKKLGSFLFGPNALTGFIFYGSIVTILALVLTGHTVPGTIIMIVTLVIPLILIMCEKPLRNLVERKKVFPEGSPAMSVATGFFELFDYLLTYLSNSLSFLRIGVFAVSHAAMMQVVMTLSGAENGGSANLLIVIIGNVIVVCMEGLIVGIQVLRLEYYEMFGRFYEGSGREFVAYRKNIK